MPDDFSKKIEKILVIDFGSQYTNLIARRIRELGCYAEVYPFNTDFTESLLKDCMGIILSGSPESVNKDCIIPAAILNCNKAILGICYGMQTMISQLGGEIYSAEKKEFGLAQISIKNSHLFLGIDGEKIKVWMSHGDQVGAIPSGFNIIASSENCPIAAVENIEKKLYGLQFHPEVVHTEKGLEILHNFVVNICSCALLWSEQDIITDIIESIKHKIAKEKVVLGLSGGVDSFVAAFLLNLALGENLTCIFVDTGLMRKNETNEVIQSCLQNNIKLQVVEAGDIFMQALAGVMDPEEKRKIIGRLFVEIFEQHAPKNTTWLAQGTIYSDVIESAGAENNAHKIKSHHNVGGLPEKMKLKIIEPLRNLFKDEVRKIGLKLGLPDALISRHPFPGPGLAIRIIGEIKREYVNILQRADVILLEELRRSGWYNLSSQAFAVFLPIKSVGVAGDCRKYGWTVALRIVNTTDFMTANIAELPYPILSLISRRIVNEIEEINRVVYDISDKPAATIEWE